jgi:uncharacterized protein YdbL (DUF1318 family)
MGLEAATLMAISTAITGGAAVYSAVESRNAAKDQKKDVKKAQNVEQAQVAQESLMAQEAMKRKTAGGYQSTLGGASQSLAS